MKLQAQMDPCLALSHRPGLGTQPKGRPLQVFAAGNGCEEFIRGQDCRLTDSSNSGRSAVMSE